MFTYKTLKKVRRFLCENLYSNIDINKLLYQCEQYGDLILIGGSIKDIGFFNKTSKDYDFIILRNKNKSNNFELNLNKDVYKINRNSFGGYKIKYDTKIFDIWTCDDFKDIENKNVKFNLDGLYINLTQNKFYADLFNQGIKDGIFEVINNKIQHPDKNRDYKRGLKLSREFDLQYHY